MSKRYVSCWYKDYCFKVDANCKLCYGKGAHPIVVSKGWRYSGGGFQLKEVKFCSCVKDKQDLTEWKGGEKNMWKSIWTGVKWIIGLLPGGKAKKMLKVVMDSVEAYEDLKKQNLSAGRKVKPLKKIIGTLAEDLGLKKKFEKKVKVYKDKAKEKFTAWVNKNIEKFID